MLGPTRDRLPQIRALEVVDFEFVKELGREVYDTEEDENGHIREISRSVVRDMEKPGPKLVGLIAQQVSEVAPGLVMRGEGGVLNVKQSILIHFLIKGMQELADQVDELSKR